MKTTYLITLYFMGLLGAMPISASAQPYTISPDGSEVTDQKTGLIWRRCAEGMSWNASTCAGVAGTFTHEAALQQAATQASLTAVAWRLPNIKELSSIADKSLSNLAIDPMVFPATPARGGGGVLSSGFWSASPNVGNSSGAWYVDFGNGLVYVNPRASARYVRLARAGQ